jgi:hypothetical protein
MIVYLMMVTLVQVLMVEDHLVYLLVVQDHRLIFHHVQFQLPKQEDVMVTNDKYISRLVLVQNNVQNLAK